MKKIVLSLVVLGICTLSHSQTDTISENIYQNEMRLGIGQSTPEYLLDIRNDAGANSNHPRQFLFMQNTNNTHFSNVAIAMRSGLDEYESRASFGLTSKKYSAVPNMAGVAYIYNVNNGIALRAVGSEGMIKFITGGSEVENERMRIDSMGNLGLGTSEPEAKLQVADGDIYISDIEKGIIMKSPDGNCWRGVLDNSGQLKFTAIACPGEETSTAIDQMTSTDQISVYPNPSKTVIRVDLEGVDLKQAEYKIFDLSGRIQDSGKINYNKQSIHIQDLNPGTYILSLYNRKGVSLASEKIIKE